MCFSFSFCFFFQAEDGIRDTLVTGVQTCALPISKEWWPTSVLASALHWELPLPSHFEAASKDVTEDEVAEEIVCGADPARHLEAIREYVKAGFDHVCIHQVGPEQEGFLAFYEREVFPKLGSERAAA